MEDARTVVSFGSAPVAVTPDLLGKEVEALKLEMRHDAQKEWNQAQKRQEEVKADLISEVCEAALRDVEAAMHADVEASLRSTPDALASASATKSIALEKLQRLKSAVESATDRGKDALAAIEAIKVPKHNLACKILDSMAQVRKSAIENERRLTRRTLARRLERLAAQRKLGDVAFGSGKTIRGQETRDSKDIQERLQSREQETGVALRADSVDCAKYWCGVCDKVLPLLADAGAVSDADALMETARVVMACATDQSSSTQEILRATENSITSGMQALEAAKAGSFAAAGSPTAAS